MTRYQWSILVRVLAFIVPLGGQNADKLLAAMRRAAPFFRARLAKMIDLRYAPEMRFELDRSFDHANHINQLLHTPEVARDLKHDDEDDKS